MQKQGEKILGSYTPAAPLYSLLLGKMNCPHPSLPSPPTPSFFVLFSLFFLIKISACIEILRWGFEYWEKSPIFLRCWHWNTLLSFYQHLTQFGVCFLLQQVLESRFFGYSATAVLKATSNLLMVT